MENEMQTAAPEVKIVSKISMKNAGVNPKKIHALPKEAKHLKLAIILGEASGIKQVDDPTHGTVHKALVGRFQAQDAETGDVVRSGMLYLPKGIHETVTTAVEKAEEGDVVRFALEMRAVRADNPAGYTYEAVALLKPQESDPLDMLAAEVGAGSQKQLSAPASEEKPKQEAKSAKR